MANFMGPMAPPQAAPQQPPQMDVRTSPSQRAQFKNFMRGMSMPQVLPNIGMGVPPLSLAPPVPQISTPMIPSSPMMGVDIFSAPPTMMADGGVVGGLNNLQQMSSQMVEALNTVVYGGDPSGGGMGVSAPTPPSVGSVPPPISSNAALGGNMNPNSAGLTTLPPAQPRPFIGTGNDGYGSFSQGPLDFYNATPGTGTVSTQEPDPMMSAYNYFNPDPRGLQMGLPPQEMVRRAENRLMQTDVKPPEVDAYLQHIIETGGRPTMMAPNMMSKLHTAQPIMAQFSPSDDIFNVSWAENLAPVLGIGQPIQGLAMGGPVGGGADAGQMAADAFSGKPDGQQGGPSGGVSDPSGPAGKADALSDILNAAPVPEPAPNYNLPQQDIMDSLNIPTPVQDVVNMATQGISMPGPMGIGSVNIAPDLSGLLGGDIGLGATYAVNFEDGGQVSGGRRTATLSGAPMDRRILPALDDYGPVANLARLLDRMFGVDRDAINESRKGVKRRSGVYGYGYEDGGIVSFFNGGDVGRERGIAAGAMGGAGPAADPDGIGAGADSGAGADKNDGGDKGIDVTAPGSTGEAQSEFQSQLQEAYDEADKTVQVQKAGFENIDQYNDFVEGIQKTSDFIDKITGVAPVLGGLKKASDFFGLDIFDGTEDSSNVGQSLVDSAISKGGTYNPETGIMSYPTDGGTVNMNSYGLSTYTGTGPDPFAQQHIDETSIGGAESIIPVLADEVGVDPCPPGYELKDGTCVRVTPNQIGGMPLPYDGDQVSTMPVMPIAMPTPEMDPLLLGPPTTGLPPSVPKNDLSLLPPPSIMPITRTPPPPSVVVPSTRPAVGPLRGPATFNQSAMLTPEFFQNLLKPAVRPIGMKDGGEVLDAAADQFLMGLRAA